MSAAVDLKGVTKQFNDVTAVKGVNMSVAHGEIFGILGPSGSGKSTLLRIIDFLESPDSGTVSFDGVRIRAGTVAAGKKMRDIGMVLQKPVVLNRSVANNLAYSLLIRGWDEKRIDARVDEELKRFGLSDRRRKNARTLSGGEMQRLSFARSTVYGPKILLLDEFAANLDPRNVGLLEEQIRRYSSEDPSRTVVMVTHNIFQAKRLCTRLALMWDGEIVEISDKNEFFENPRDPRSAAFVKGDLVY
jgi:tungstate transport system ATP-binding protein